MPIPVELVEKVPKYRPDLPWGSLSGYANSDRAGLKSDKISPHLTRCQLNFSQLVNLNWKSIFESQLSFHESQLKKWPNIILLFTLQKPDFPRNPGGIFWKYLVPYPYLYPYIYIYIYIYKLILIFLREKKRERERERERESEKRL